MISIRTDRTKSSLKKHLNGLKGEILGRAQKRYYDRNTKLGRRKYNNIFLPFINKYLEKILTGDLTNIISLQNDLYIQIDDNTKLLKDIEYVFSYKWFRRYKKIKYDGFKLAKSLDIPVCPYCNRNLTTSHSIDGQSKNAFPEFDHFYPHGQFPLLALSFYNLIPSCTLCNSTFKGVLNPADSNIFYPYSSFYPVDHYNFSFTPNDYDSMLGKGENLTIEIETEKYNSLQSIRGNLESSFQFFDILGTYSKNHKGLIKDIINKRIAYSDNYINNLESVFGLDFNEAYKILFEVHFEDHKLMKRPFSKLKKDIYNEVDSLV